MFYFVKDDDTGHVSPLLESRVYKARPDVWGGFTEANEPPDAFSLVSPADGTLDKFTTLILDWEDTQDPDGDRFTYTVLLSKDDVTFSDPLLIEYLPYSTYLVTLPDDWDTSNVYWKVKAIDEYGAVRESSEVWVFEVDKNNPPLGGWIEVHVNDITSPTGAPVDNAQVDVGGTILYTALGGYYLGIVSEGIYSAVADAVGFIDETHPSVGIIEGELVTRDFELNASADDTDGDGLMDYDELYTCAYDVDYDDADSDDDGIADGDEDTDQDGVVDANETDPGDADTDNDGIQDGTEQGETTGVSDPDGAGPLLGTEAGVFQPDLDPSTTTDPLDDDTDDDGTIDGGPTGEDKNSNGKYEPELGETDPNPQAAAPIPTLSEWGMMVLTLLLLMAGMVLIRRKHEE